MAPITPVSVHEVLTSRQILLTNMKRIGFYVEDYLHFSIDEIDIMYKNNQLDMLIKENDIVESLVENKSESEEDDNENENENESVVEENSPKRVYIRYNLEKRLTPDLIQDWIDDLYVNSATLNPHDCLYVVTRDDPNKTIINFLIHMWETEQKYIVIESIKRLQYNVLDHVLVPPHRVMKPSEIPDLFLKYNIASIENMPEISRFDPVAKQICIRPDEICHILRPSKSAIETNYYRVCVNKIDM